MAATYQIFADFPDHRVTGRCVYSISDLLTISLLTNEDGSLTARSHTILAHTPIGRFLEPDELVGTLHYLVSDASKAVTGTVSVIDGGFDAFSI